MHNSPDSQNNLGCVSAKALATLVLQKGDPNLIATLARQVLSELAEEELVPEHEPVMLMRGRDPFVAGVILTWANLLEANGAEAELIAQVRAQAQVMLAYRTLLERTER